MSTAVVWITAVSLSPIRLNGIDTTNQHHGGGFLTLRKCFSVSLSWGLFPDSANNPQYVEDINQSSISAGREESYGVAFPFPVEWHEEGVWPQLCLCQHHWPSNWSQGSCQCGVTGQRQLVIHTTCTGLIFCHFYIGHLWAFKNEPFSSFA